MGDGKIEMWPRSKNLQEQCGESDQSAYLPLSKSSGAVVFNTASGPVICGGTYIQNRQWIVEDRCWIHRQDIQQWVPSPNMKIKREQASAIEVNNDQTLIIGGINEKGFTLRSTELYR